METSLHRDLKRHYAADAGAVEVVVEGYRIDAVTADGELVEIQHASLGALRTKTIRLLQGHGHRVRIVKPIVLRKRVTTVSRAGGPALRSRMSPVRGEPTDLFLELVHFCTVFPRERLTLEAILVEAEEVRVDRQRPTRRGKRFRLVDQRLVRIDTTLSLATRRDLIGLLPWQNLPPRFDTAELASAMEKPRWFAQKVAYCLRHCGAARAVGKRGNSRIYSLDENALARPRSPANL
ncbi:MAG: hypothetical protein KatS3mg111_1204 [Pirellulaceae bacterium]|nr:MAG: hypothetical protein KatS3mg111_1204 [Pirellulaceae bacterium]